MKWAKDQGSKAWRSVKERQRTENHIKEFRPRWKPMRSGVKTDQRENGVLSRLVGVLSSTTCPALSRQTPSQNFPAAATLNTLFSGKQTKPTNKSVSSCDDQKKKKKVGERGTLGGILFRSRRSLGEKRKAKIVYSPVPRIVSFPMAVTVQTPVFQKPPLEKQPTVVRMKW